MLTGKQRSYLKGMAHTRKPLAQIGKEGLSEAFLKQMDALFEQHELVKVNVLDNSGEAADEVAHQIMEALDAEFVQSIGNKFTLYRQSRENPMIQIPGADNKRVLINLQKKAQGKPKEERLSKRGGKISKPGKSKRKKSSDADETASSKPAPRKSYKK